MDTVLKVCESFGRAKSTAASTINKSCYTCCADTTKATRTELFRIQRASVATCLESTDDPDDPGACAVGGGRRTNTSTSCSDGRWDKNSNKRHTRPSSTNQQRQQQHHCSTFVRCKPDLSKSKQELPILMGYHDESTSYDSTAYNIYNYDTHCEDESSCLQNSAGDDETDSNNGTNFSGTDEDYNFRLNMSGLVTDVVTTKSSWSTHSGGDATFSTTNAGSSGARNSRDDNHSRSNSHHGTYNKHKYNTCKHRHNNNNSSSEESCDNTLNTSGDDLMMREFPSFSKSREFRSFGSDRSGSPPSSKDDGSLYSLKPTFIPPDESKLLQEQENNQYRYYNYILRSKSQSPSAAEIANEKSFFSTTYQSSTSTPALRNSGMKIVSLVENEERPTEMLIAKRYPSAARSRGFKGRRPSRSPSASRPFYRRPSYPFYQETHQADTRWID